MSSKLLYTLKDENNRNLQKQIGCMNGFFQKIYCHQFLTGRRVKSQDKISPVKADQSSNNGVELNSTSDKASGRNAKRVAKEKHRASTESSFSSSSCSSSFSSLECNRATQLEPSFHGQTKLCKNQSQELAKDSVHRASSELLSVKTITQEKAQNHIFKHVDSPRPLQFQGLVSTRHAPRDAPRFSFDGRLSQDTFKSLKIKELPRLSLDSKQSTIRAAIPQQELASYKRQSSVVAKLMGLEALPSSEENQIKPSSEKEVEGLSRSVTKSHPSSKIPIEPAPWGRGSQGPGLKANTKASSFPASVYGEIEKRLADIEFKQSGKDLRALKRILEAMQKNAESRKDGQGSKLSIQEKLQRSSSSIIKGSSSPRSSGSLNMITKPTTPVNRKGSVDKKQPAKDQTQRSNHNSADRAQTSRSMQTLKVAIHVTGEITKSSGTQSPRLQKKQSDSSTSRKQIISQVTESRSPRKSLNSQQRSNQSKETSSKARDLRNSASHIRAEATSTKKNLDFKLVADRSVAEPAGVASEQPSPISVLNATFYRDESPSPPPVKKVPNFFKDEEAVNSETIQYLVSHMGQDESINYTTMLTKDSTQEHRYIYKILSASGLLRDLESSTALIPLHPSLCPISLQVFLAVEQSMARTRFSNDEHLSKNTSRQKSGQRIQRKLIFDAVNEIIEHKLVPKGCLKQWVSPNKLGGRGLQGQELLRDLCSEIDQLEGSKPSWNPDDEDDSLTSILLGDLMNRSKEWVDYPSETSGIVSDIEGLIFKDLIAEVVNGERGGLQTRYCKQLFY